jgi:hypothetical protein
VVVVTEALRIQVEWLDAPGVVTPELAATWGRYQLWIGDKCVTQVEAQNGDLRQSVYGSLYPLAEWITSNWWFLARSVRRSAIEPRYWSWANLGSQQWLRSHNLRGAGDGMAWPNLTLVPEGSVTCASWRPDSRSRFGSARFTSAGRAFLQSMEVMKELAKLVHRVLERLDERGVSKSVLAEDWNALGSLADDERDFCVVAARLGLDPFVVPEEMVAGILAAAQALPGELLADFFDNADPAELHLSVEWVQSALAVAARASTRALRDLGQLREITKPYVDGLLSSEGRSWEIGYEMARRVRGSLDIDETVPFDVSPWLAPGELNRDAMGIQGVAVVDEGRCGVVVDSARVHASSRNFAHGRALGRALVQPESRAIVLSAASGYYERVARAFAAELLAPATGIRTLLDKAGREDDLVLEAVAQYFRVSPLVVRHQYDNQLAEW